MRAVQRPKRTAADLTPDKAARMIQGVYHRRKAWGLMRLMARALWTVVDDGEGGVYYLVRT